MRSRSLSLLGVAALLALPLFAEDATPPKSTATAPGHDCCAGADKKMCAKKSASKKTLAKSKPAAESAPAGAASMRIARDPETGELRLPTPEENRILDGRRAPVSNRDLKSVVLPDGTHMILLDEDHDSSVVVRRNADGSITQSCVHSGAAAPPSQSAAPAPASPRVEPAPEK